MNYYLDARLSYMIKTGELKHEIPDHNNPEDYGLTNDDAIKIRLRYLRSKKKQVESDIRDINSEYLLGKRPFAYLTINVLEEKVEKLNKDIYFNNLRLKEGDNRVSFNIQELKKIPLDKITAILPNGFFVNNPFRQENSPSNSLAWDKKVNKWTDFGSGERGDIIDLVMTIEKCNFYEACERLSLLT